MVSPSYCNACGFAKRGRISATHAATLQLIGSQGTVASEVQVLLCDEHMQQARDADGVKVIKCCPATGPAPDAPPTPGPEKLAAIVPSATTRAPVDDELLKWLANNNATPQIRKAIVGFIEKGTNLLDTRKVAEFSNSLNVKVGDHTLTLLVRAWLAGQIRLRIYARDGSVDGLPLEELWTDDDTPEGIVAMLRSASDRFILRAFYTERV